MAGELRGVVKSVSCASENKVSKSVQNSIMLVEGVGVQGDAHQGATSQHALPSGKSASTPNLRQVHLMHSELLEELCGKGFKVAPGVMAENVTTEGLAILDLPTGTKLRLGEVGVVQVTGLREPCNWLNGIGEGLMEACLDRDTEGLLIRKSGIMSVVVTGGEVKTGDMIVAELPSEPHVPLKPV